MIARLRSAKTQRIAEGRSLVSADIAIRPYGYPECFCAGSVFSLDGKAHAMRGFLSVWLGAFLFPLLKLFLLVLPYGKDAGAGGLSFLEKEAPPPYPPITSSSNRLRGSSPAYERARRAPSTGQPAAPQTPAQAQSNRMQRERSPTPLLPRRTPQG